MTPGIHRSTDELMGYGPKRLPTPTNISFLLLQDDFTRSSDVFLLDTAGQAYRKPQQNNDVMGRLKLSEKD